MKHSPDTLVSDLLDLESIRLEKSAVSEHSRIASLYKYLLESDLTLQQMRAAVTNLRVILCLGKHEYTAGGSAFTCPRLKSNVACFHGMDLNHPDGGSEVSYEQWIFQVFQIHKLMEKMGIQTPNPYRVNSELRGLDPLAFRLKKLGAVDRKPSLEYIQEEQKKDGGAIMSQCVQPNRAAFLRWYSDNVMLLETERAPLVSS